MSAAEITMQPVVSESELPLGRFYRWERERANRPFLTQPLAGDLREWTWAEAAREVRRMAAYLQAKQWTPGTNVAILSKNCAWWVMADLSIWMAGHVTVPVYPTLMPATVRQILEHSEVKACFAGATDDVHAGAQGIPDGIDVIRFPAADGRGVSWDSIVAATSPLEGEPARAGGDLATIFYTSGTTGAPKGVMHSFGAFAFLAKALSARLNLSGEQRLLSYLPLAHIFERSAGEIPALMDGWHMYFPQSLETFLADLQRARPTLFYSVPRLLVKFYQGVLEKIPERRLNRLLRIPIAGRIVRRKILRSLGLDAVKHAACGSAPLAPELLMWYRGLGLNLLEGYGLTEALVTHLPRPKDIRPGYSGYPLDGVEAKAGDNGELLLKSPMNMLGYYKDPQGTAAAFTADGFFRTGDIVEIDNAGQIRIVGRIKEQFKTSKGKYVAPAPIEIGLATHPEIESVCVMGIGLAKPFAVVVPTPEARRRCAEPDQREALEASLGELMERVNSGLEHHERIAFIVISDEPWTVANGLLTPTLKLRRKPLEQRYMEFSEDWSRRQARVIWK